MASRPSFRHPQEQPETSDFNEAAEHEFEELLCIISKLDIDRAWDSASEQERRILIDELIEIVTVGPKWFSVKLFGSPAVRIRYGEVGLKDSDFVGVGRGEFNPKYTRPLVR